MSVRTRVALIAVAAASIAAAGPATNPVTLTDLLTTASTAPATTQAAATVDAAAESLLAKLSAAYTAAGPLHVSGKVVGQFDVAGRSHTYEMTIDGRTDGAGRFRHDASGAGLVISDGTHIYLYDRKRDSYGTLDASAERRTPADVDQSLIDILLDENPALLFTLTNDPAGLLRRAVQAIHHAPATQGSDNALLLDEPNKKITLWLNDDGSVRSSDVDFTPLMTARHATAVKSARATLTYDHVDRDPLPEETFTWHPPASATEFDASPSLMKSAPPTTRPSRPPHRP